MKTNNILSVLMAFLMLSSIASAVEIRGTVVNATGSTTYTWTANDFPGFYYDIDNGRSSESLILSDSVSNSDRVIAVSGLKYITGKIPVDFEYFKDKGQKFEGNSFYELVGWEAEKWVAVGGKVNKLAKLLINDEGTDKRTLQSGGSLTLGNGYVLKIQSVDANAEPRQAWIQLLKDGVIIDDGVIQHNTTYTYTKTVGGEQDVLVLAAYVSSIFAGQETSMIQFQYLWMIDESKLIEVKSGTKYGVFEANIVGDTIELTNPSTITLSKDSDVTLMGNMKFKVANSDTLRFYPYVDVSDDVKEVAPSITPVAATPKVNVTSVSTPPVITEVPTPVPTPTPQIVYVTVTPEPTPVPTKPAPGFEAIFAIAGLIAVAFIVLRQRKD